MTIPSALTLIVNVFTEPVEQARAIGIFGGCGCIGNGKNSTTKKQIYLSSFMYSVLGVMIGAIFVQYASWHWIFWSLTLITIPIALLCIIVVPPSSQSEATSDLQSKVSKFKSLDLLGIGLLTSRRFSYSIGTFINHKNPEQLLSFFLFLL